MSLLFNLWTLAEYKYKSVTEKKQHTANKQIITLSISAILFCEIEHCKNLAKNDHCRPSFRILAKILVLIKT